MTGERTWRRIKQASNECHAAGYERHIKRKVIGMRLGIGSYTYTWALGVPGYSYENPPMTAAELLHKACEFGCKVVQICDNINPEGYDRQARENIRLLSKKLGLEMQVGGRGVEPGRLQSLLQLAVDLDARLVRSMLPKEGPGSDIADARRMLSASLPEFEKKEIPLSLENHDRHGCEELASLVTGLDCPYLGICLDTVNSFGAAEDPRRVMDSLLPLANCLHIKDFTISRVDHQMGFVISGAPAGDGMLDITRAVSEFSRNHPTGATILELWTPFLGTTQKTIETESLWAEKSIAFLNNTFGHDESQGRIR